MLTHILCALLPNCYHCSPCSAGIGRTGAFCALSTAIERVKAEGMVDVFHTVKHLRTQRPHMVQTVVSMSLSSRLYTFATHDIHVQCIPTSGGKVYIHAQHAPYSQLWYLHVSYCDRSTQYFNAVTTSHAVYNIYRSNTSSATKPSVNTSTLLTRTQISSNYLQPLISFYRLIYSTCTENWYIYITTYNYVYMTHLL